MKIVIKNPAPAKRVKRFWGDYHFGLALQRAFEAQGIEVVQHLWPKWDREEGEDVILVLRGIRRWTPPPGPISILWALSHPASVTVEEIEEYTFAYVASETHRRDLLDHTRRPVELLRQCSEIKPAGSFAADRAAERHGICFVGNARGGIYRDSVYWAVNAGLSPQIIGREWEETPAAGYVESPYLDNSELESVYRRSRIGINDHWPDMKHYGYINNRVFDCLCSGLPIITDEFPEIRNVFAGSLTYARDAESFTSAAEAISGRYDEFVAQTHEASLAFYPDNNFAARAARIVDDARHIPPHALVRRVARLLKSFQAEKTPDTERRDPRVEVLRSSVEALTNRLDPLPGKVLHVFASPAGKIIFATVPDFAYMTAGFGIGAWEVDLAEQLHQVAHLRFDVIVIENATSADGSTECPAPAYPGLARCLSEGGVMLVPEAGRANLGPDRDLTVVHEDADYVAFRRSV